MNRFRTRKKSLGEASREGSRQGSRRPSFENDVPALPSFAKTFKRKKTPAPEPKPEIDLTSALPPSDDFRTSLLMPKLCARFSMLKEQDDPNSLLGKANDDSVLFPKRASRLDLFNNRQGLSDIAEVDSLRGSIRPPFASIRTESYGSEGYVTDDGSIMGRSKPGEGNTMFGGRQKIYKIPVGGAGSVKNFGNQEEPEATSGGTMAGKPIYESDTTMSTFQQLRQREKEEKEKASHDFMNIRPSREQDRSGSPPFARYNRNRETSSSTTSAPSQSRASTAATSVASQKSIYAAHDNINGLPPSMSHAPLNADKTFIKSRRLYGQAFDRDTQDNQAPLQRISSFNRCRAPVGPLAANPLRQSRSATNLGDRFQRSGPLHTPNTFRAESPALSPTPPRMGDFDLGLNEDHRANMVDSGYGRSPTISPPMSPDLDPHNPDPTLVASLEPNDIGKATASGAFNKPKRQYDEQQYLQRQLQMQEERNTPSPQFSRPFSPALSLLNDQSSPGRSRNNSLGSTFSRTNSIRRPWIEDRVPRAVPEGNSSVASRHFTEEHVRPSLERSFFTANSATSGEMSPALGSEPDTNAHYPIYPGPHPATQADPKDFPDQRINTNGSTHLGEPADDTISDSRSYHSEKTITQSQDLHKPLETAVTSDNADSPTLGPVGVSNGLSGLVRAHLRSDSGQSSIHPDDTPRRNRKAEAHDSIFGHGSALNNQSEPDEGKVPVNHQDAYQPPPLSFAARNILEQARTLKTVESNKAKQMLGIDKAQRILGGDAPRSHNEAHPPWHDQTRSHHNRGASTETQQEREELAQELAERRRIVQDKLQNFVEVESRSASPAPSARTHEDSPAKASNAFGLLKKSSRGSLAGREKNSKAMKMLGIEHEASTNPPPSLFKARDQFPDRAMPSRSKAIATSSQPQGVPHEMSEALGSKKQPNKAQRSEGRRFEKHSRHSSKSSSAYSGNSQRSLEHRTANGNSQAYGNYPEPPSNGNADALKFQTGHDVQQADNALSPTTSRPSEDTSERSQSATSGRLRSNSKPSHVGPGIRTAPAGTPYMINPSTRPGPPNPSKSAPALRENQMFNSVSQPNLTSPRHSPTRHIMRSGQGRKQSVNKQDISEPTFISCTSSVDTIDLPSGASLKNGMDSPSSPTMAAPPIPARDSRRKRTMTLRQAFGRSEKADQNSPIQSPSYLRTTHDDAQEERSTFSDDEPAQKTKLRLKKLNRDYGMAHDKSSHPGTNATSPTNSIQGHHPLQTRQNISASTAMF